MSDGAYIDHAADLVAKVHESGDERLARQMDATLAEIANDVNMLPTLLLRYHGLKAENDELLKEIQRLESVQDTHNQFLHQRGGNATKETLRTDE